VTLAHVPAGTERFVRPLGVGGVHWTLHDRCPPRWWAWLERCGGGFFHTPAAVEENGDAFFAELTGNEGVSGIAAGVWRRCRLSRRARHVYLPSTPAILGSASRQAALDALVGRLRADGAAEITMDSFDAAWVPQGSAESTPFALRMEYLVEIDDSPDTLTSRFIHHHRRHLKRGEREGWHFGVIPATQVPDVIAAVQQHASLRAAGRGTPFAVGRVAAPTASLEAPWGTAGFGAWRGDELLAAVLVGWGGRRAFYLQGGSTPAGYDADASTWLHWRIMRDLADRGLSIYSLGGAPGTAERPDDPSHGLHRFKMGFGASASACCGLRWVLSNGHLRAHKLLRWVRRGD
jgi:hypothetical protein